MRDNEFSECELAHMVVGFFQRRDSVPLSARRGKLPPHAEAPKSSPPRCCREIALERAKSSAVVSAARRQGVNKARKIRWLGCGRIVLSRRPHLAWMGVIPYPVRLRMPGKPLSLRDYPGRPRRGGRPPHGQCGRGWFPVGGRGKGQNRRLAVRASRHRGSLPGWT